jgi:hypothetical protein
MIHGPVAEFGQTRVYNQRQLCTNHCSAAWAKRQPVPDIGSRLGGCPFLDPPPLAKRLTPRHHRCGSDCRIRVPFCPGRRHRGAVAAMSRRISQGTQGESHTAVIEVWRMPVRRPSRWADVTGLSPPRSGRSNTRGGQKNTLTRRTPSLLQFPHSIEHAVQGPSNRVVRRLVGLRHFGCLRVVVVFLLLAPLRPFLGQVFQNVNGLRG